MSRIVVGVDASECSRAALAWALEEARLRRAGVVAVHAWTVPTVSTTHEALHLIDIDFAPFREAAQELLEAAIAEVAAGTDVELTTLVTEGPPAPALMAAARDADLLVVGSRGLGGFKELLLGSVSHQVAHHAPCPVVIVRTDAC